MNKILLFLFCFIFIPAVYAQQDNVQAKNSFHKDFLPENAGEIEPSFIHNQYDYSSVKAIPIQLKIRDKISTRDKDLYDGKKLVFIAQNNTPVLKSGQKVTGRVSMIIPSGMNGIPYSIVLDDFKIPNVLPQKLKCDYQKDGFNRSYLVLPLKWALTFLPPTGSLTNFIFGGHAKITSRDTITIYYYPQW